MKPIFKRTIWLSTATALVVALLLEWPAFRQQAAATESNIDTSISTGSNANDSAGPKQVFVSDQVGYAFYVDSGGDCVYSKTTDGGANWGGAVTFDNQTGDDCLMPTVWYDRWTPGDTTGNYIHMVTKDPGADGLWYNRLDTSNDTLLSSSSVDVHISTVTHSMGSASQGQNFPAITKATDGDLYIGVEDDNVALDGDYVIKCTGSCETASNWTLTEDWTAGTTQNNPLALLPLAGGDLIAIHQVPATNDMLYQTYDESANDWSHHAATWATIDLTDEEYVNNHFGATVDPLTNDVYLAYVDTETNLANGGGDDDISVWRYTTSWTQLGDAVTDYGSSRGLVSARMGFNVNNTDLYVAYSIETTPGTTSTRSIYYKTCNFAATACDAGGDWSAESAALNSGADIYDSLSVNLSSRERIHVVWRDDTDDDLRGETAANIGTTYKQQVYRWLANTNDTTGGSALAAENTLATLAATGDAFRLRMLLRVGGDGARISLDNLKLQFAAKSGTCDTGYSGESYADVTTGTAISYKDNASPTDGSNLTTNGDDPTDSGFTIRNQTYEEANNFTNSNLAIASGEDGKWDFALYDNGASASTSYCFRVVYSDAAAIAAPTVVPEIITAASGDACSSATTADFMRHGNRFSGGSEYRFCWAN